MSLDNRPWTLSMLLLACACVDARAKEPLGTAEFAARASLSSADYVPVPAAKANVAGAVPAPGGQAAPPPPPPPAAAGSNALPPTAAMPNAGAPAPAGRGMNAAGRGAAGMGAAAGGAAVAGAPAAPGGSTGTLTIDFKSVNQGGRYAPRNVGAVWIETSSGMFVKTLERWAGIRANHLTRWAMASGGWGSIFGGGNTADQMDAVSRATLRAHEAHRLTWDLQDAGGKLVPDGSYNVVIEVTEDNFVAGAFAAVAFQKGPAPQMVMAPDKAPYSGLVIRYQP